MIVGKALGEYLNPRNENCENATGSSLDACLQKVEQFFSFNARRRLASSTWVIRIR